MIFQESLGVLLQEEEWCIYYVQRVEDHDWGVHTEQVKHLYIDNGLDFLFKQV